MYFILKGSHAVAVRSSTFSYTRLAHSARKWEWNLCHILWHTKGLRFCAPHVPLLQKLADIEIDLYLLRWVQSCLTSSTLSSRVHHLRLPLYKSSLASLKDHYLALFILHLNDVVHFISEGSEANIYADNIAHWKQMLLPISITQYFTQPFHQV